MPIISTDLSATHVNTYVPFTCSEGKVILKIKGKGVNGWVVSYTLADDELILTKVPENATVFDCEEAFNLVRMLLIKPNVTEVSIQK